jgi:hypothetical protein
MSNKGMRGPRALIEEQLHRAVEAVLRSRARAAESPEIADDVIEAWATVERACHVAVLSGAPVARDFSFLTWVALIESGMEVANAG